MIVMLQASVQLFRLTCLLDSTILHIAAAVDVVMAWSVL